MQNHQRFRTFLNRFSRLWDGPDVSDAERVEQIAPLLAELIGHDDWLPEQYAQPDPQFYRQYLLYCDPQERFSVVSFVWGPGQKTPVHDHTVWGLVGMMRGSEVSRSYAVQADGSFACTGEVTLRPGDVDRLLPGSDIHQVENAFSDKVSISIHVYGANIGAVRRHVFDPLSGQPKSFVSGYSAATMPNVWDRSEEVRAQPG